jgi:hypothetical protein
MVPITLHRFHFFAAAAASSQAHCRLGLAGMRRRPPAVAALHTKVHRFTFLAGGFGGRFGQRRIPLSPTGCNVLKNGPQIATTAGTSGAKDQLKSTFPSIGQGADLGKEQEPTKETEDEPSVVSAFSVASHSNVRLMEILWSRYTRLDVRPLRSSSPERHHQIQWVTLIDGMCT